MNRRRIAIISASAFLALLLVGAGSLVGVYYRWRASPTSEGGDRFFPIGKFGVGPLHFGACFAFQDSYGSRMTYRDLGTSTQSRTMEWTPRNTYCLSVTFESARNLYSFVLPMPQ